MMRRVAKYKIGHVLVNYKNGTEVSYDNLDDRTWDVWGWINEMDRNPDVTSVVVTFVRRWGG